MDQMEQPKIDLDKRISEFEICSIETKKHHIIHYLHRGKRPEISHFLKMVCSMSETKQTPYYFRKPHCSMGENDTFQIKMWIFRDFRPLNLNLGE